MLWEKLDLKGVEKISDILNQVHPYINDEEALLTEDVERNKISGSGAFGKQGDIIPHDDEDRDMHNGPHARFYECTPLNTSR